MRNNKKNINLQFSFVQGAYWVALMPIANFSLIILQERGFSASIAGILIAIQSISAVVAQPIIAAFAERHPKIPLKLITTALMFIAILVMGLWAILPNFFLFALFTYIVLGFTMSSIPAFLNAMAMQLENSKLPVNYGLARGIGSISFALTSFILGKLVLQSSVWIIFPFFCITAAIFIFIQLQLYNPSPEMIQKNTTRARQIPRSNLLSFLKRNKKYAGFCISSVFLFFSNAVLNTFLPTIVDGIGGNMADQSFVRSISAMVELPAMIFYGFLVRKFQGHKLLILSSFSFFLKALFSSISPSLIFLNLTQLLQMTAYGIYTPAAVHFSDHQVSPEERIRAQAISMVASGGLGGAFGNLLGGLIMDSAGLSILLAISVSSAFIGFVIMWISLHEKNGGKKIRQYRYRLPMFLKKR